MQNLQIKDASAVTFLLSQDDLVYGGDASGNLFLLQRDLTRNYLVNFNAEGRQPRFRQADDCSWHVSALRCLDFTIFAASESDERILAYDTRRGTVSQVAIVHEPSGMDVCGRTRTLFNVSARGCVSSLELDTGTMRESTLAVDKDEVVRDLAVVGDSLLIATGRRVVRLDRERQVVTVLAAWPEREFDLVGMSIGVSLVLWGVNGVFRLSSDNRLEPVMQPKTAPVFGHATIAATLTHAGEELVVIDHDQQILFELGGRRLPPVASDGRAICFCYRDGQVLAGMLTGEVLAINVPG